MKGQRLVQQKGKIIPEISTANHVGSRFSTAAQMTALNYAELFNWTAVVWFLLRWTAKETAPGWRPEVTWVTSGGAPTTCCPCHSPLQPPQPALAASGERRAASVALRVSERHIPHTSVSLFRSGSVFFCMNRRETDALYQVAVFQRGRDFDLNMFLLLLLDKTSCQLASDHMCRIKLSVLVMKKFVFSVRFLFFFAGRFQTDADSKYKELKKNNNRNSSADLWAN